VGVTLFLTSPENILLDFDDVRHNVSFETSRIATFVIQEVKRSSSIRELTLFS